MIELRVEVVPAWPFRLGGGSADGLMRRRGASLQRLMHLRGERVHVGVVQPARLGVEVDEAVTAAGDDRDRKS